MSSIIGARTADFNPNISPDLINAALLSPAVSELAGADLKRWVLWRWETNAQGKPTKVPYQAWSPDTLARSNDPTTWATFDVAYARLKKGDSKADGVGFMLLDSGYAAFDLDHCRDPETGAIEPWAQRIIDQAETYCEVTPSRTGVRIIGKASGPNITKLFKGPDYGFKEGTGFEIYRNNARYITMTGYAIGHDDELANLDALIDVQLKEHKERDAAASVNPADFDWNKRQKEELARPFKNFAEVNKVLDDKAHEDRSAGAYAFMKSCVRRGYTPEETFDLMTKHADTYIMGHYADADGDVNESRVRADIVRAFIKKTKKRPAPPQEASGIERREVFLHKGKIHEIIDQSEAALIAHGVDIYQRGALVRPSTTETIVASDDRRDTGTRLIPIRRDGMREIFSHYVDFKSYSATEDEWLSADCPKDVGSMYVEREGLWKVRKLAGVINAPTLRPDGTILDKEGYDPDTGLLYLARGVKFQPIPEKPQKGEAQKCLVHFKHLLSEFPFVNQASLAVALSGMLTALVRRSLPTAPLHAYNAPVAGSGKSLLVDLASLLASGNLAPVIAQGRTEEETEKRLDAALIAGDAVISLDNCTLPLRGDKLCMALSTAGSLSLRILGLSKNALVVNNAALFATGNNLEIEGDMTRRVILCSVNPKVERPELRAFKMDPVAMLREKRPAYVMMALMILRAYIVAGRPDVGTTPLAGFVDWSRLVRDALVWLGEKDACATMDDIIKVDPKREQLVNLLHAWHVALGDREVTAAEIIDAATAGAMAQEPETEATREARGRLYAALRAIAAPLPGARSAAQIDAVRLGLYLRKNKDAIREGLFIGVGGSTRDKVQSWYAGETKRVPIR